MKSTHARQYIAGATLGFWAAVLAASCSPQPASAQTIGAHTISAHSRGGMNNFNPGAFIRTPDGYTVGGYWNSQRRLSLYAGRSFTLTSHGTLSADITLGAITGYRAADVLPLAVPSVAWRYAPRSALRLAVVPPLPIEGTSAVVHLIVEKSL